MRARLPILVLLCVAVLVAASWRFVFWMPGASSCDAVDASVLEVASNLRRHVDALAGRIGPRSAADMAALEAAARYVDDELRRAGWSPRRQPVGGAFTNVVAERGTGPRLVIGAHYDTVATSPGADDDASGVAALLEIARLLAPLDDLPIRLVAFVNEEAPLGRGELRGSRVAAATSARDGENLRGMMALESIGFFADAPGSQRHPAGLGLVFPDVADYVVFVADPASRSFLHATIAAFRATSPLPSEGIVMSPRLVPHVRRSDHAPYWDHGYPAVMITDSAEFRNPHYHRASDLPDTLDYGRAAQVTVGVASAARCLVTGSSQGAQSGVDVDA